MAKLPPYTTTGERIWHYAFRGICGLIFLFLIYHKHQLKNFF